MDTNIHERCNQCGAEWHRWKYEGLTKCPFCGNASFETLACFGDEACPVCLEAGYKVDGLTTNTALEDEHEAAWAAFTGVGRGDEQGNQNDQDDDDE